MGNKKPSSVLTSTDEELGLRIIDAVIKGRLLDLLTCGVHSEHACVCLWRINAPEQIGRLVRELAGEE